MRIGIVTVLAGAACSLAAVTPPAAAAADDGVVPDTTARVFPEGRWDKARTRPDPAATPEEAAALERLGALGYVAGSRKAPAVEGVTIHDPARAVAGTNFLTSGHAPVALLLDMDGRVLHHWHAEYDSVWPGDPFPPGYVAQKHYFRRAAPQPDGSLLAIFEGLGLVKLDRDSRVLWARRNGAHHELEVLPSGDIVVLTREERILPRFSRVEPVVEDFVTVLTPDGEERRRISLIEAFERSPMRVVLEASRRKTGDFLHTNAVRTLDGLLAERLPAFAAGNILLSFREISTLAVLDPDARAIVWAHQGDYARQHDPRTLPDGRILLFDNGESRSRILELDPVSGGIRCAYRGTPDAPFFSEQCGTAQRLENGNTLITESENGRAFEITPDGTVVWEWISPYRAGEHRELIATLFEMRRLPPSFGTPWLGGSSGMTR